MLLYVACIAVFLPCILGVPMLDLTQARLIQTKVDQGQPLDEVFADFKRVHNKQYESEKEESVRRDIFESTVQQIKEHNEKYARGEKSYFLGVNQFSDLMHKEFLSMYTGHLKRRIATNASAYLSPANVKLPTKVDWREKGYVTPVKNQGNCGSCWSFSTTGSLEGQHFRKTGKLVSLSEQQLVDCSGNFGNHGCHGGLMDQAFEYIKSVGGIEGEKDYPYLAEDEDRCYFKKNKERANVTGFVDVTSGSEDKLMEAVGTVGPISVAIDASHNSFQSYAGGVYDEPECSTTALDHGVLAVGYGTDPSDYWLVKNSWGPSWGVDGYVKMTRNKDNQCGIATQASYPLV